MEVKCTSCGEIKEHFDFYMRGDSVRQPCSKCICKSSRDWKKRNKTKCKVNRRKFYLDNRDYEISKATDYSRRKLYGISSEQYTEMLHQQGWACAICKADYSEFTKGLHVDHDHKTGKVRGLLCHNCNTTVLRTVENYRSLIPKAEIYLQRSI